MPNETAKDKRVIGLYGEMRLAMELHRRGWQVYRAYIDETFDFVIMKTYCGMCKDYVEAWKRTDTFINKKDSKQKGTTVTNLCAECHNDSLRMLIRLIQAKTSEGKATKSDDAKVFSFHPKLRYHLADGRVYYAWIQVWDENNVHFYIFHTDEVQRFDDIQLPSYQITDNQKLDFRIDKSGNILTQSKNRDLSVFKDALDNFDVLDAMNPDEENWQP